MCSMIAGLRTKTSGLDGNGQIVTRTSYSFFLRRVFLLREGRLYKSLVEPFFLGSAGLAALEDFLAQPMVVVGGHPGRRVARVTLGAEPTHLAGFLKWELSVSWKDVLAKRSW